MIPIWLINVIFNPVSLGSWWGGREGGVDRGEMQGTHTKLVRCNRFLWRGDQKLQIGGDIVKLKAGHFRSGALVPFSLHENIKTGAVAR